MAAKRREIEEGQRVLDEQNEMRREASSMEAEFDARYRKEQEQEEAMAKGGVEEIVEEQDWVDEHGNPWGDVAEEASDGSDEGGLDSLDDFPEEEDEEPFDEEFNDEDQDLDLEFNDEDDFNEEDDVRPTNPT